MTINSIKSIIQRIVTNKGQQMNKFTAMKEHIKAREELGIELSVFSKIWGCMNMLFIDQDIIEAATTNIRAGRVRYDREKHMLIVE